MSDVYAATDTALVNYRGARLVIHKGDLASADHELVAAHPELFGPLRLRFGSTTEQPVEQVTAGPGEKRTGRIRQGG